MGYYTHYTLSIHADLNHSIVGDSPVTLDTLHKWCQEHCNDSCLHDVTHPDSQGQSNDSWKWYEHDEDMHKLSLAFPDVVFKLHGEGEEDDDKWDAYYKAGKKQRCRAKITVEYPPFDASKLA